MLTNYKTMIFSNSLFESLILTLIVIYGNFQESLCATVSPVFITTMSNFEVGQWVLTTTSPTTVSGFSYQNTAVTYLNYYTSIPNVGFGISFLNSLYTTTTSNNEYIIDVSIVQQLQSSSLIQANFTASTVQQLALNYIVSDSSLFLDVRTSYSDLTLLNVYTVGGPTRRSSSILLPYKTKSNTTNAVVTYNTIGLSMIRQSHLFQFSLTTSAKGTDTFSLTLTVGPSNRMRFIRICSISYEAVANTINPPYYMDLGTLVTFSTTIPDSSGLTVTSYGTVFCGMIDWTVDDSNSVLNYNANINGLSFLLTTASLTQSNTVYFWYRSLSCPDNSYISGSTCISCHYTCLKCNSPAQTSCILCPATRSFISTNKTCACNANYINVNVSLCVQLTCQPTCLTCANLNQCGTCDAGAGRLLSGVNCVCKSYTVDVYDTQNTIVCFPCHATCLTCSEAFYATSCLSCNLTKDHRYHMESNNTCACIDKYFPPVSGSSPVCSPCDYSCATCSSLTSCLTCDSTKGRTKNTTSNLCSCTSLYYDGKIVQQCIACANTCSTCNSAGCLTCNSAQFRTLNNKACKCIQRYYDDKVNVVCPQCNFTCETCIDLTQCSSCNTSLLRYMDTSTGVNICLCSTGYYSQTGLQACLFCDQNCLTCSGPNNNNCLSCVSTNYRQLSLDLKCICKDGYYEVIASQKMCASCHYTCETCSVQAACLTCNQAKFREKDLVTGLCVCQAGYYDNNNQLCRTCNYKCLTCSSGLTCDTCDTTTRNDANLSNCVCLSGFWDNGFSKSCLPCAAGCSTCINGNNCSGCPESKVLTLVNQCICMPRTYEPNCISCSHTCLDCINTAIQCTKCNGTAMRYFDQKIKRCLCYQGYFDDGTHQLCLACHPSCLTCINYASCQTCPMNRVPNGSRCSCIQQYYQNPLNKNCLACEYSCQSCLSFSQCTMCNASNFRQFPATGLTNLTLCVCRNGYYDNSNSQLCYKCEPNCLTCINSNQCQACDSTKNRVISPTTKQCLCNQGYFEDKITFLCVKCDYSCITCLDQTGCLACPIGRSTQPSGGFCLCDKGSFDSVTHTCQPCSYPCLTCVDQSTKCTLCDDTRKLITITATCSCLPSTFQNGAFCQSCLPVCSQCTSIAVCTVCLVGSIRNLNSTFGCPCMHGYHDSNSSLLICLKCHHSCQTCQNTYSCDTCVIGRTMKFNSTCVCPILRFYDDGVNGACIPCAYNCLTCAISSTSCTNCLSISHRTLVKDNCICQSGYFNQNTNQICASCQHSCATCSTTSFCTSCNGTFKRSYVLGPFCECSLGYFDDGTYQQCATCDYKCLSCSDTKTKCQQCPDTRKIDIVNHACPCDIGFFDVDIPTCSSCLQSCLTCINNLVCQSCPETRYLQQNTSLCLCKDRYYDNLQKYCQLCHQLCLTCVDYDVCLTCNTAIHLRNLVSGSCACSNGYFDPYLLSSSTNLICQSCSYSCQTCSSLSQCTSCSGAAFRQRNVKTKQCSCKQGYYDDMPNTQCLLCPFDCFTCSDENTCTSCASQRTPNSLTNRCDCAQSYYTNGQLCEVCSPECSVCTNLTFCTDCNGPRVLVNNKCVCPIGQFMVINTYLCSTCQYTCESCISKLKCATCNETLQRYILGSYCRCKAGYFDVPDVQNCSACQYSCKTCINKVSCTSCHSTAKRQLNKFTSLCSCQSGYYEDPLTLICVQCSHGCVTCNNGDSCQTCNSLYFRELDKITLQCLCPSIGYFDDGSQNMCQTCDYKCLSCRTIATKCTSCPLNTFRQLLANGSCQCKNGYYQTGALICPPCSHTCDTCSGTSTNCLSCLSTSLRTTTPACSCAPGLYDNGVDSLCQLCDYRCQTCLDRFTCDTCDSTMKRVFNNLSKMCDCMPVFYDQTNNTQCISCRHSCLTCNHPTLCLTCPPITRVYKNSACPCVTKYYDDGQNLNCLACDYSCSTCIKAAQCSLCSLIKFRQFNSISRLCNCLIGYFDTGLSQQLCVKCDQSCKSCTNLTYCATCPPNLNKTINLTVSNFCTCLYGYYDNYTAGSLIGQTSVCYACHYSCEKCINKSFICTNCQTAKHRIFSNYQCLCPAYFYDNGISQLCASCASHCVNCWGSASNQCTICDDTSYFLNNSCLVVCPDYYMPYINSLTLLKVCAICTPFCLQCSPTQNICIKCQSSQRMFRFNSSATLCLDSCPQFYYDIDSSLCQACISPCLHCTNKYVCTDCISGYYLNTYCYKCQSYCYSCSGPTAFDCLTCINGYYLQNGLCRKLTCGQYQYVNSLLGCVNCTLTYPNSLTCDSFNVISCANNYMLSTTNNGSIKTVCMSCANVKGYQLKSISTNGQQTCMEICGDGIIIHDLCDDGNKFNGDGCSSTCKIQPGWTCLSSSCNLKSNPHIFVTKINKISGKNQIQIYLQLTIGIRLVTENFLIHLSTKSKKFVHAVTSLSPSYTSYKLLLSYQESIQSAEVVLQILSPISSSSSRLLQTLAGPLSISLQLQLSIQINTQPPATFVSPEVTKTYDYLIYVFLALHVICYLIGIWTLYKGLNFFLPFVDLITNIRIIYLICTFGMINISDLLPRAMQGLRPFVYPFGSILDDFSSFSYFDYTTLIFSSCIIQLILLIICVGMKYFSSTQKKQAQGHYYYNILIYCFSIDIFLSCICTFSKVKFSTFVGSYSWAVALVLFIIFLTHNLVYISEGKNNLSKTRIGVPTKSFVTHELDQKEKKSNSLDDSQFSSHNQKQDHFEVVSQNKTQVQHSQKSQKLLVNKQSPVDEFWSIFNLGSGLSLFQLSPSYDYDSQSTTLVNASSVFYNVTPLNKLSLYHLPLLNSILPLILVLLASLIELNVLIRSILLLLVFIVAIAFFLYDKTERISTVRNIKLLINYITYAIITMLLIISSAGSFTQTQWIDTTILSLIILLLAVNFILWIVNVRTSAQYKQYLIEQKNLMILQRNKLQSQPRRRIYSTLDEKSNNNSPIKNIFRKYPLKNKQIDKTHQQHDELKSSDFTSQIQHQQNQNVFDEQVEQDNDGEVSVSGISKYSGISGKVIRPKIVQITQLSQQKQRQEQIKKYYQRYNKAAQDKPSLANNNNIKQQNNQNQSNQLSRQRSSYFVQLQDLSSFDDSQQIGSTSFLSKGLNQESSNKKNPRINSMISLDNQQFISQNKKTSPTKVSNLRQSSSNPKINNGQDKNRINLLNNNDKKTILNNATKEKVQSNDNIQKRIKSPHAQRLLITTQNLQDSQILGQQQNKNTKKHYEYKNPSKSTVTGQKIKDKKSVSKDQKQKSIPKEINSKDKKVQQMKSTSNQKDNKKIIQTQKPKGLRFDKSLISPLQNFSLISNPYDDRQTHGNKTDSLIQSRQQHLQSRVQNYQHIQEKATLPNINSSQKIKQRKISQQKLSQQKVSQQKLSQHKLPQQTTNSKDNTDFNKLKNKMVILEDQNDDQKDQQISDLPFSQDSIDLPAGINYVNINKKDKSAINKQKQKAISPTKIKIGSSKDKSPKKLYENKTSTGTKDINKKSLKNKGSNQMSQSSGINSPQNISPIFRPSSQQLSQISSIRQQQYFNQQNDSLGQEYQSEIDQVYNETSQFQSEVSDVPNVFAKILKDHQKYKHKKVDNVILKQELKRVNKDYRDQDYNN